MQRIRIAVVDSGIDTDAECRQNVIASYGLIKENTEWEIREEVASDMVGHGTAVAHIIVSTNPDVDIISFRICDEDLSIEEDGLVATLEYIYQKINVHIINVSAGVTYLYSYKKIFDICERLRKKGVWIVSAFDNDGSISFPAALESVIGVDVCEEYAEKNEIAFIYGGIADVLLPNRYYRTMWKQEKTIIKGTSFACAFFTGQLSQTLQERISWKDKKDLLRYIADKEVKLQDHSNKLDVQIDIQKAILFPVNKESDAILRFSNNLKFEIIGVFDDRRSGRVGKNVFGYYVDSVDEIDWSKDFDTVILSCTHDLSKITGRNYQKEFVEHAKKHNKKIYTLESLDDTYSGVFYPGLTPDLIPHGNQMKLHKTTIPVVGVFGTSSRQGKFTLQRDIISGLSEKGYRVGSISSEPSGYLFDADYVFHFGYHADVQLMPWQSIAILNEMIWKIQLKSKDVIVTGCQSGSLHYSANTVNDFAIPQYTFFLGTMPDFIILCINPHDDIEYLERTIQFINSIDVGRVRALAVFPVQAISTVSGIGYKRVIMSSEELELLKKKMNSQFEIPVYAIGNKTDLLDLCNQIIDELAEE